MELSKDQMLIAGRKIHFYRKMKGLRQKDLADKIDLSLSYVGKLETGRVGFTYWTLTRIAEALEVHISQLIEDKFLV